MTYPSYMAFVEAEVKPRRARYPHHKRLDGNLTGGNWKVVGVFRHDGRHWKVHADSHYEPLLIAYEALSAGDQKPFVEEATRAGRCLNLRSDLRRLMSTPARFKYIYIYET